MCLRQLAGDQVLTQYGTAQNGFRNAPRLQLDVDGLSLIAGELSGEEAARVVRIRYEPGPDDLARHTTAGILRAKGFVVERSPTRRNRNHVSVRWPGEWDDSVAKLFDECFKEGSEDG